MKGRERKEGRKGKGEGGADKGMKREDELVSVDNYDEQIIY